MKHTRLPMSGRSYVREKTCCSRPSASASPSTRTRSPAWPLGKLHETLPIGDDPHRGLFLCPTGCDIDRAVVNPNGDPLTVHLDVVCFIHPNCGIRVERCLKAEQQGAVGQAVVGGIAQQWQSSSARVRGSWA